LIAQIKNAMKRSQATRKRKENQEKHILLGMKMMSPHQTPHSEDEKANICLIAEEDDESSNSSSVSSCASLSAENYSKLLPAFQETHEEANRLVLSNNRLKGLNNWLEERVKTLEEELEKSKIDF